MAATADAGVQPLVHCSSEFVETPMLLSSAGAVVTVLNWRDDVFSAQYPLEINVTLPFKPASVESVEHGPLTATPAVGAPPGTVTVRVPLAAGESWPAAAIPMENPYCSCKLLRTPSHPLSPFKVPFSLQLQSLWRIPAAAVS